MTDILLVDFNPAVTERLMEMLRAKCYSVSIHSCHRTLSETLSTHERNFDIVIIDVSTYSTAVRQHLTLLTAHRAERGPRPMILCVSQVDRGPQFELQLEREGARVVYV